MKYVYLVFLISFFVPVHSVALKLSVNIDKTDIKVYDQFSKRLLLSAKKSEFVSRDDQNPLDIQTDFIPQDDGFDVVVSIKNETLKYQNMVDFYIPGIYLENKTSLNILSTNTHLYMQKRDIKDIKHPNPYFSVGSLIRKDRNGNLIENECYYGADTFTPYAPVIVTSDDRIAVGSASMYPFLAYKDNRKEGSGKFHIIKNKFYPKMRIYKDQDSWRYAFIFPKSLPLKSMIAPGNKYTFIIPVRFKESKHYIQTLSPYKKFLHTLYGEAKDLKKDISPILTINFAFYGSVTDQNKRGWAWGLEKIDKDMQSHLSLYEVSTALSEIMKQKGYKRVMFVAFSGVYDTRVCKKMDYQLPFQILSNLEYGMQKDIKKSLNIFRQKGQKVELWWGIAGSMPLDENGELLDPSSWKACDNRPFLPEHEDEKEYALRELNLAKKYHIDTLILDAYTRMEEKRAFYWLKDMKKTAPKINFALEMELDIMHTQAAITLQPENELFDGIDLKAAKITKAPILAEYLNPNSGIRVWLQHQAMGKEQRKYVKDLIDMGYTPMVIMPDSPLLNHDENNVTKRVLAHPEVFMDVKYKY